MTPPRPVLAVLAGLAVVWTAVILLWPDAVIGLTFDDAFYYFEIGHRLVLGQGSTFDGLHATNGYHPLWLLPSAAVHFVLPPGDAAVRALLVLQLGLTLGGLAALLGSLRWRDTHPADRTLTALVLGCWLLVPIVTRTFVNGLESGIVAPVHALILALCLHQARPLATWSAAPRWAMGGLLGLALLARTDGALLTPLVCLWALPDVIRERRWLALVPVGLPPALTLLAFLALNQAWFDTPMQVSGTLKRVPPGLSGGLILALCGAGALGTLLLGRSRRLHALTHLGPYLRDTAFHASFLFVITGYYTGLQTFARQWYFAPVVLWLTGLLVAGCLDLAAKARADRPQAAPARAVAPLVGILGLPLLAAAVWTGWSLAHPDTLAVRRADRAAARWLDDNLPQDARVASWDAGLIGYTTERTVINLDGVVNDVDWLRRLGSGRAGERLRAEGVGWVVNHGSYEDDDCVTIRESLERLGAPAPVEIVEAWPYEQVGRINGGPWGRHAMATCVVRLGR